VKGGDDTPGGGCICLSVTEVHLTVGDTGGVVSRTNNGKKWNHDLFYPNPFPKPFCCLGVARKGEM